MTGREVSLPEGDGPSYVAVGSILGRANDSSIVWGSTGSFGTESAARTAPGARYTAVPAI